MKVNLRSNNPTSFEGLRKRPSYNTLVGEINKPVLPLSAYPDRKAYKLRSSNWLAQLDGESHRSIEEMQRNRLKEQQKENLLRDYSASHNVPLSFTRAHSQAQAHDERQEDLPPAAPPAAPPTRTQNRDDDSTEYLHPNVYGDDADMDDITTEYVSNRQFHHAILPPPMTQSLTRSRNKVKKHQVEKTRTQYYNIASDDFDDVVGDTHKVNVEHADLLTKRQQKKHTALMKDFHKIQQNIENTPMTALHPLHTEGGSSSSNQTPKPKVKRKAEPIEMMDETGLESIPEEVKKGMKHKMDKPLQSSRPKSKAKTHDTDANYYARAEAQAVAKEAKDEAKAKAKEAKEAKAREKEERAKEKEAHKTTPKVKVAPTEKSRAEHGVKKKHYDTVEGWKINKEGKNRYRLFFQEQLFARHIYLSISQRKKLTIPAMIQMLMEMDTKQNS